MRRAVFACTALVVLLAFHTAHAYPLSVYPDDIVSGQEIVYDLSDSFLEVEICLGGCQAQIFGLSDGSLTLEVEDPDNDDVFDDGARVRMSAFDIDYAYSYVGGEMEGRLSFVDSFYLTKGVQGAYSAPGGQGQIDWLAMEPVRRVGTYTCLPFGLCELQWPPTTAFDESGSELLPPAQLSDSALDPLRMGPWEMHDPIIDLNSFSTLTLHVVGLETSRRFCQFEGFEDSEYLPVSAICIPEPTSGGLLGVALGALGVAAYGARRG